MRYILLCILIAMLPLAAHGHGVIGVVTDASSAVAVEVAYSTGEPMAYAEVSVFSPSSPKTEVLAGYADRNGHYAFIPDEEGEWRIEAADGMGHKSVIKLNYTAIDGITAQGGEKSPLYLRILLGISLVINIFAVYSFIAGRKAHAHK